MILATEMSRRRPLYIGQLSDHVARSIMQGSGAGSCPRPPGIFYSLVMLCASRLYFVCVKAPVSVPAPGRKSELLRSGSGVKPAP